MKKFKFNRFNIIIISSVFIVLLFFVISLFRTYSDIVQRDASKIEGDTVYVNDLASDYYYWLGMNYVGDLNSNNVNYTESSLKMVTINYYGYPNGNPTETGYVSLDSDERQNKFVYYKYFPISNNQITFDLIDNPFSDRPYNKGFNGWTSTDGTITTNSLTKTQSITVSSSVNTINIYASWANANVIYLKGTTGDDNFDGSRPDRAVGSWSRAFELLRSNSSNQSNRELNIIVLTGDINYSINYSNSITQTYTSINTTYTQTDSFDSDIIIAYRSGNNYYALTDNSGSIGVTTLTSSMEVPDNVRWKVASATGGYTIRNFSTNRYLNAAQNGMTVSMNLSNNAYVWENDSDLPAFFHDFTFTYTLYTYEVVNTLTSGENYLITRGTNPQNALDGAGNNTQLDPYSFSNTTEWKITNVNGNNYTIQNAGNNQYLNYSNANNEMNLALGNSFNWSYDSANRNFSAELTHRIVTYSFQTGGFSVGNTGYIGYLNNGDARVVTVNGYNPGMATYDANDTIPNTAEWQIVNGGSYGTFRIYNSNSGYYLARNGRNSTTLVVTTSTSYADWHYNTSNHYLYQTRNNTNYYLYVSNNNWSLSTYSSSATAVYFITKLENVNTYNERMYIAYNNGWKLENTSTNATVDLTKYTSELINETKHYYLRYNGSAFVLENNQTNANLNRLIFNTSRTINRTTTGNTASNSYYSSSTNIAATITSLYNHIDYRNDATWTMNTSSSYIQVLARNDLQLEYLSIAATGYNVINDNSTQTNYSTSYASLVGNSKNVRVGRGLTPTSWTGTSATTFAYVQGGGSETIGSSSNNNNAYQLTIESGRYSGLMLSHIYNNYSSTNYYDYHGTSYLTMGCDYDRVAKENGNLDLFYRMGSSNYAGVNGTGSAHGIAYLMRVKSGTIGMYYFNNNSDDSRAYSGIYVGGLTVNASSYNDDTSSRILIIEGGSIANINGGLRLTESGGNNGVATKIYMKGGTLQNIVGGAGVSTTYGDRFISVTGGNVAYSISGGSNGIAASDESQQSGRLGGDSYVHVGGNAHIGTHGSGTLYNVNYGSILGAGNGNSDYRTSGRVNTSHVYVSGDAIIEGSVYGGGNFGPVLEDSNIQIEGATIKGNVYGGANQNGVGTVTINESTIYNVTYDDNKTPTNGETYLINKVNGSTRNLLSENSNQAVTNTALGSTSQPSNYSRWLINTSNGGYTIRNANYNHYLTYTTGSTPGLGLSSNTTNAIWNYDSTNKTFYQDITYTVSTTVNYSYTRSVTSGTEYLILNTNSSSAYSLNLNGGNNRLQISTSTVPSTNVWVFTASGSGYTIRNKESGEYLTISNGDLATSTTPTVWTWDNGYCSTTSGYYTYYIRYRNSSYYASTSRTRLYLATFNANVITNSGRYYIVYDSSWKLSTTASSVMLSTFTSTSTTGYALSNQSNGDVHIVMNDGHVQGAIYGGSCQEGNVAGKVTIDINGGQIESDSNNGGGVFGGGYGEDTYVANGVDLNINDTKNVSIGGTVYGGSALGTIVGNIDIDSIDNTGNGTIRITGDFYCGSMGSSSDADTGKIQGNCSLDIDGGTYTGSVYGGNNANGSPSGTVVVTTGGTNTTTITNVFGGGNQADSTATSVTVNIENNSNITNAYGGGNRASVPVTNVNLKGGNATYIFGGSNQSGNITTSNVTTTGGTSSAIYGGNKSGGTTSTSNVLINGGTIVKVYGGGQEATTGTTSVRLKGGTVTGNTYGGGQQAGVTTSTTVSLEGGSSNKIFGGSDTSGNVPVSYVTATSGTVNTIYGGNNIGGKTSATNVTISNITVQDVYGGGCSADTGTDSVTINSGTITNVYGGGEAASVDTSTTVSVLGGSITSLFGGSNQSGTVPTSSVNVSGGTVGTIYGGNNAGGTTTTTSVSVSSGTITDIYGGGKSANSTTTTVTITGSTNTISNIFGGCKEANATTTNVILSGGGAYNVFGGSNTSGTITNSHVTVNSGTFGYVYGGNNDGGKTVTTDVRVLGGTASIIFGGGKNAETDNAAVIIDGATVADTVYGGGDNAEVNYDTSVIVRNTSTITNNLFGGGNNGEVLGDTYISITTASSIGGSAYGGGNNADVTGNTSVVLDSGTVTSNIFGGGKNGKVSGSTNLKIRNGTVRGSAFAGGDGETAVVNRNTTITVEGTSHITNHVFGGGNAAPTGNSASNNSMGVVNITGGAVGGNVYGGANTSVLYGETVVNIGYDAVTTYMNDSNYTIGNIGISGTVFGGGEANAEGLETYDFDFISVTQGIIINIDGRGHTIFDINGSIFGSGNASSTTGYSRIYINNYGSANNIKNNVSLQRADIAVLNNSHMALSGATDRTNEYSQVLFSISRITELDLKNNSSLYLENGANLLNRFRSLNADGSIAQVTINDSTHAITTKSTNNRLYILEDKVLNIALNQNVTAYGEVDGMTFFGMFKRDRLGNIVRAMYDTSYVTGATPTEGDLYYFSSGSYVLGLHENAHNIKVDGFYTNYEDPDNAGKILVDYVQPTPDDAEHYMWVIGANVQSYDIELTASKYSTLGTYEFPFVNNAQGNTTFVIKSFTYNELDSEVSIIDPDFIPRIANTASQADNTMGLAIKPGIGWVTVGEAHFLTDANPAVTGIKTYKTENSNVTPSFVFYLYHSKNIQSEGTAGTVVVSVQITTPIDDLTNHVETINFNITINRALFSSNDYEGAMTPGRQYKMFTSSKMDITAKSSLSAYYSLYTENAQNIYHSGYHRVLTSNVILPVNTKITMIDFASADKPEYYYYIVNAADNAVLGANYNVYHEVEYPLSYFTRMGSLDTNNKYDDATANGIYYDSTNHRAIEEFIFIVDFGNANISDNMIDCSLLIDILDQDDEVIYSVLGIQRSNLQYSLYADQQSAITVDAEVTKALVYIGDVQDLRVRVDFNQSDENNTNRIIDTTYYEQKLGIKISFINQLGNQVNGVDLMGTSFTLDGETFYARSDGTLRIKLTDRVANAFANIRINTENSSLASGMYTIKVEGFYSPDGIYFGPTPNSTDTVTFRLMNELYGLRATIPENELIFDSSTGANIDLTNTLNVSIEYSGAIIDPNIKVALYRRSYDDQYDMSYNLVDLADYILDELDEYQTNSKIYDLIDEVELTNTYTFHMKTSLVTGTYKLEFRLYDGTSYVGNITRYIIIK